MSNTLCQLYCVDDCQHHQSCNSRDDESVDSQALQERVNSQLFLVRETESGEVLWRRPIQDADVIANHLVKHDNLKYRLPSHSFRSMLLPTQGIPPPAQSSQWVQCNMRGILFAAFHAFNQRTDNAAFRFPEMAYCWFSDKEKLTRGDEEKWAFYYGYQALSTEDALGWIVYQLMDDIQGEHFAAFLFHTITVVRKHLGSSWEDILGLYHQTNSLDSRLKFEEMLTSIGSSLNDPPQVIWLSIEIARAANNELFYGDRIKSPAAVEELHQELKNLAVENAKKVEFFSFIQMIMKAYIMHMSKQFTLLRLMFETSSTGTLTDFYNEPPEDPPNDSDDSLIGFRELHKILKTLWPKMSMQETTLIYREAFDISYPQPHWGRPSPDGISFESFLVAADRRCLFSRMRAGSVKSCEC
jgi:hypothetical protein